MNTSTWSELCITSILVRRGNILIFTNDKESKVFDERGEILYFSERLPSYFGKNVKILYKSIYMKPTNDSFHTKNLKLLLARFPLSTERQLLQMMSNYCLHSTGGHSSSNSILTSQSIGISLLKNHL